MRIVYRCAVLTVLFLTFVLFKGLAQFNISVDCRQLPLSPVKLWRAEGGEMRLLSIQMSDKKGVVRFEGSETLQDCYILFDFGLGRRYEFLIERDARLHIQLDTLKWDFAENIRQKSTKKQNKSSKDNSFSSAFLELSKASTDGDSLLTGINLSKSVLWNTLLLPYKIEQYAEQQVKMYPDSVERLGRYLMQRVSGDTLAERRMLRLLVLLSYRHPLATMEQLRLFLTDIYLKVSPHWLPRQVVEKMMLEAQLSRFCQVGMQAQPLLLRDTSLNIFDTELIKSRFLLLYFYSTDCATCRITTPTLYTSIYKAFQSKDFEIVAVYTGEDVDEWRDYLQGTSCLEWKNVIDSNRESFFWDYYDVTQTPSLYLLDSTRHIISKNPSIELLYQILDDLF